MSDYKLISQELCTLCAEVFDISLECVENNFNSPIGTFIESPNVIALVYFILELSCRYRIILSEDMIENCTKWSLKNYTDRLLENS